MVSLVAISSVFEAHALCSLQKCTSLFGQSDNVLDAGNGKCAVCKKPDYVYFDERAKCIPKSEYNEIMRQNRDAAKQSCEDSGGVWEGQCLCDLKEGLIGDKNIDNKCICLPGFARVEKGGRCRVKTSTIQKCINSGGQWPDGGFCAAHTACNRFPGMVAEIMDGKISCQPKLEEDGEISEVSDSVIGGMFD